MVYDVGVTNKQVIRMLYCFRLQKGGDFMQVKLIGAETGIGSKSGKPWYKAYLKLVNAEGKTNVVVEWLGSMAGIKAVEWCKNGKEPEIDVKIGFDDFFRKTIIDIELCDLFDDEVEL